MRFQDSGLQSNKLVEEAFNYGAAYSQSLSGEALMGFAQQIDAQYLQQLRGLTAAKEAQRVSEQDFDLKKAELDRMRVAQLNMGPGVVGSALDNRFIQQSVAPALEVQKYSDKASPELVAAILLADSVRSPVDYKKVAEKFGDTVAELVAEIIHIRVYPAKHAENVAAASSDAKRVYMGIMTASLDNIVAQAQAQLQTGKKLIMPPGQEEALYGNAKVLWGNDKKLDRRLLDTFNRAAQVTSSEFRMEVDAKGALELVKGAKATPKPRPAAGGKPDIIGDDIQW
jgi:hypothetical protein